MKLTKTITINDEPLVSTSTGLRTAELTYTGKRYVYVEADKDTHKIMAMVHMSDEPEMEIALERLTQDDSRVIIEIDAIEKTIAACLISDDYELAVDNYSETLPDGTVWEYNYGDKPNLKEIYDYFNMEFDAETGDFVEYKFDENDISDDDFLNTIDSNIAWIDECIETNTYTESNLAQIQEHRQKLVDLKESYDGTVKHWKFEFPTCSVL